MKVAYLEPHPTSITRPSEATTIAIRNVDSRPPCKCRVDVRVLAQNPTLTRRAHVDEGVDVGVERRRPCGAGTQWCCASCLAVIRGKTPATALAAAVMAQWQRGAVAQWLERLLVCQRH